MSNPTPIQATERDTTLNPRQLRSAGFLPATLYGKAFESQSIQVRELDFTRLYGHGVREFELVGLGSSAVKARVQDVQQEGVSGKVLSIQFQATSTAGSNKGSKVKEENVLTTASSH